MNKTRTSDELCKIARERAWRAVMLEHKIRSGVPYGAREAREIEECELTLWRLSLEGVDSARIYIEERKWLADLEAQWCDVCEDTKADCWCWRRESVNAEPIAPSSDGDGIPI
jgi:hypothetical protein